MNRSDVGWAIGLAILLWIVIGSILWLAWLGIQFLWGAYVNILLILNQTT